MTTRSANLPSDELALQILKRLTRESLGKHVRELLLGIHLFDLDVVA